MGDPAEFPDCRSWSEGWTESWVIERSETSVREVFSLGWEGPDVSVDLDPEALVPSSGIINCGWLAFSLPLLMKDDDEYNVFEMHGTTYTGQNVRARAQEKTHLHRDEGKRKSLGVFL